MIVIATNNGWDYIDECVRRCIEFTNRRWKICVVDTASSDLKYREYVRSLCHDRVINFLQSETPCWDFGAYMQAYRAYADEKEFLFHHDSVYAKSYELIDELERMLKEVEVVPWMFFRRALGGPGGWDDELQHNWLIEKFGTAEYQLAFYGPNFAIRRSALDKLATALSNISVDCKSKQTGMERGWAILAKQHDLSCASLEKEDNISGATSPMTHRYFDKALHRNGRPRT